MDDYATAEARYQQALALYRVVGDQYGEARTLMRLGVCAHDQNDFTTARLRHGEALTLYRTLGARLQMIAAVGNLGLVALYQGDYEGARPLLEEGLVLGQEFGDKWSIANGVLNLALVPSRQADYPVARSLLEQALALTRDMDDNANTIMALVEREIAEALEELGLLATQAGQVERAARLLGAAAGLRERLGAPRPPADGPRVEQVLAAARAHLGEAEVSRRLGEGQAMTLDLAVAYAVGAEER